MKRKNVFVSLSLAVMGGLLVSCESETFSNEKETEQTLQTKVSTTEENEDVVLFENTEELIEFYDALSEGDILLIQGINSKVFIISQNSNSSEGERSVLSENKYDFQTKKKIEFAKWCDKQLEAGKKLLVGKNADGTYWAIIVK